MDEAPPVARACKRRLKSAAGGALLKAQSPAPPEKKIPPPHPFQLALLWKQQIAGDSKLNRARITVLIAACQRSENDPPTFGKGLPD
jgi:hypothetical protein